MNKKSALAVSSVALVILFTVFYLWRAGSVVAASASDSGVAKKYNVVVFMTDDQRWDTLWAMPIVQQKLIRRGVTFTRAFVTTPLCCPDRASFLSGGFYPHNTGVLANSLPNGSAQKFYDKETLPVMLQTKGYNTALFGKYLNGYELYIAPNIPNGWTLFDTGKDYNDSHRTNYLKSQAINFIRQSGGKPFFIYFSTHEPHGPATPPEPGEEGLFANYRYRDRAFGEEDLSDKPAWVRTQAALYNRENEDKFHQYQLRSLQKVDKAVGDIFNEIAKSGKLSQTVFIFTSDNGYLWGEHGLITKSKPYDEAIRVPLIFVMPGVKTRMDAHLVVTNLDIPTTILRLVGINRDTDGMDLRLIFDNPDLENWRSEFLIETFGYGSNPGAWAGIRQPRFKYIEYATGEKEFYDLRHDTYELENQINNPLYKYNILSLAKRLDAIRGLVIISGAAPAVIIGIPYNFQLVAWGGEKPYTWGIEQGQLPLGLSLNRFTGLITGLVKNIPGPNVSSNLYIKVEDSSIAKQTGRHQVFIKPFEIKIKTANAVEAVSAIAPYDPHSEDDDNN